MLVVPPFFIMKTITIDFKPTPKQLEAQSATERFILYGGALGGGKTVWLANVAIDESLRHPNNLGLLCRARLSDLKDTTLKTLEQWLPTEVVALHHKTERYYKLINGSVILYDGLGDLEDTKKRLGGLELGWFGVDQAEEITESQFNLLDTRLRLRLPGIHYHGFLTANPAPGWLRDRFIDQKLDDHRFIPSLPKDNPYLPADYEENLKKRLPEPMVRQLMEGQWDVDMGGNYLIPYSQIREATQRTIEPKGEKVAGVDISRYGEDETVFILRQGDTVLKIVAWSHQDTTFSAGKVASLIREYRPDITYIDSVGIGAGVFDPLNNEGFDVKAINVGEKALDTQQYANRRAEYYNLLAKRFEKGEIDIPDHDKLCPQLAGLKYKYQGTKLAILSKEEMRKEGVKSPDYADALMLAFIDTTPEVVNAVTYW